MFLNNRLNTKLWNNVDVGNPCLCFVHSYSVIPRNIPFMIQRDELVCKPSNSSHIILKTYISAISCGACVRPMLLFDLILSLHQTI